MVADHTSDPSITVTALLRMLVALLVLAAFTLAAVPAQAATTQQGSIELLDDDDDDWVDDSSSSGTSLYSVARAIDADDYWDAGLDGSGVDVAIIDSGVVPTGPLGGHGKIVNGPDLSFESQAENLRYLDTYGHGTHLGAIIAGFDPGDEDDDDDYDQIIEAGGFLGIAPGARLVSLKVADANGAVDVSQAVAAIDWVVEHRTDNGLDIKVLNLAFGTDGLQPHAVDPLHYAVERAWQAGIFVVVSAGNDGNGSALRNPANDPYVLTVGASDSRGTSSTSDDLVADFSSCGNPDRHVDVVAPGKSIISMRANGSHADQTNPGARVGSNGFKGSGTSQAAAVASGAAALIIDQRPGITPDQLKALLMDTAEPIAGSVLCQGAGSIDLGAAKATATPNATQAHVLSDGTGSFDAVRGTHRVVDNGVAISGEIDIFGNPLDGASWSQAAAAGASWSGGEWNGASWSGASWSGASWSGASWSGASWSGASWSSKTWSGASWSGASWSGASWSGASWSGASWSGDVWMGVSWDGPAAPLGNNSLPTAHHVRAMRESDPVRISLI